MTDYRITRWKTIRWVMAALIAVTLVVIFALIPNHYDAPVHLTAANPVITEILPPEGQEEDSYCKYYQVEFDLENLGGEPLSLDFYRLDYTAKDRDFWTQSMRKDNDVTAASIPFLPCGTSLHFRDVIRVSTYGQDGDIFPIELRYDDYEVDLHLADFQDPAE